MKLGSLSGTQITFSSGPFLVGHVEDADRAGADPAAGERGVADEDERV